MTLRISILKIVSNQCFIVLENLSSKNQTLRIFGGGSGWAEMGWNLGLELCYFVGLDCFDSERSFVAALYFQNHLEKPWSGCLVSGAEYLEWRVDALTMKTLKAALTRGNKERSHSSPVSPSRISPEHYTPHKILLLDRLDDTTKLLTKPIAEEVFAPK